MSLDRAISSGKEHRKPYRKSKAFDASCRNHGRCSWCEGNRRHANLVREIATRERMNEFNGPIG